MEPRVLQPAEADEYLSDEGCHILETGNDAGDPALSVARARVAPGVTTRWHLLQGVEERYLVISGHGRVEVGELAPAAVGPGDLVRIPAGVRQRIANTGTTDLLFYALCTPRYVPGCYRDLEAD